MASFSPLTTFSLSALCKEMWNKGTKICKNHAITPWQERGKSLQRHLPWVSFQIGCPHGVEIHDLTRTTSDNALRTWCGGSIQTGLEDFHQARHYCSLGNCGPCLRARQVLGYRCLPRYLHILMRLDGNVFSQWVTCEGPCPRNKVRWTGTHIQIFRWCWIGETYPGFIYQMRLGWETPVQVFSYLDGTCKCLGIGVVSVGHNCPDV